MSIGPINSNYVQSILTSAIQAAGLTTDKTSNSPSGIDPSSQVSLQPDNSRLSPFAQLVSTLQELQQSDPAKYQQVTQQIATNLQSAAQTAQSDGNTAAATQLNQLAGDFTNASKSGQLPNIQDLAQAVGGHHRHHHAHAASADSDSASSANNSSSANSSSSGTTSSSATQTLSQLLAAFQTNGTQGGAQDPMNIILSTLSNAGITGSNS
jgi:hypothetical protein